MANSLLLDIVQFLVDNGLVQGDGIDTFRDYTPEAPDALVSIHEYSGSPVLPYDSAAHRSVQILVRDPSADTARQKAFNIFNAIHNALNTDGRLDFTPTRWGQVYLRQLPFFMKRDESNRAYYIFNIGITTNIE